MQQAGIHHISIDNFIYNYEKMLQGSNTYISAKEITNPDNIPNYWQLKNHYSQTGQEMLSKTVMIKLNGGLGTSMGLKKAKSLLKVKDNYRFLDIIAKQAEIDEIPLIFMDSFNTRKDTLKALAPYHQLQKQAFPLDFLQSKVPKISLDTWKPATYIENPQMEWCPPGHGDIYTALYTEGLLEMLLEKGITHAFISNADNLGATMDMTILGYIMENNIPFLMEVAERTESDKKGGHLARLEDNQLILREIAQCPPEEIEDFQNFRKYTYFNTNNIWVNLEKLLEVLDRNKGNMKLPVIQNRKKVNPRDKQSEDIIQLETAMGAAIQVFEKSSALQVPRTRFLPVKKTSDLLKIQSDLYYIDEKFNLVTDVPEQAQKIVIELDENYFKKIDDYEARVGNFKIGLKNCNKLSIKGDVKFNSNKIFKGKCIIDESH